MNIHERVRCSMTNYMITQGMYHNRVNTENPIDSATRSSEQTTLLLSFHHVGSDHTINKNIAK